MEVVVLDEEEEDAMLKMRGREKVDEEVEVVEEVMTRNMNGRKNAKEEVEEVEEIVTRKMNGRKNTGEEEQRKPDIKRTKIQEIEIHEDDDHTPVKRRKRHTEPSRKKSNIGKRWTSSRFSSSSSNDDIGPIQLDSDQDMVESAPRKKRGRPKKVEEEEEEDDEEFVVNAILKIRDGKGRLSFWWIGKGMGRRRGVGNLMKGFLGGDWDMGEVKGE
ncbi:hypothetical protein BC829DRAFT_436944 [Chytridium lagenaria]|nr:hypothetical protein BC829DRAFT_436944 [Chytridium lagenaria]